MTRTRPVADIVAGETLNDLDLDDDDVVVGVIVCVKVVDSTNRVGVVTRYSPSLDWVQRVGIYDVCHQIERADVVDMYLHRD